MANTSNICVKRPCGSAHGILVDDPITVMYLSQAGVEKAVAIFGDDISVAQARFIPSFFKRVVGGPNCAALE